MEKIKENINGKKPKNKLKLVLGIGIILLILIVIIGIFVYIKFFKVDKLTNEQLKQLVKNDYIISYALRGNVEVSEAYVDYDGIKYYAVDDDLLKDFKKLDDLIKFIDENYLENMSSFIVDLLNNGEDVNHYREFNNTLYVLKSEPYCQRFKDLDYNFQIENISKKKIHLYTLYYDIYIDNDDNRWHLKSLDFTCSNDDIIESTSE